MLATRKVETKTIYCLSYCFRLLNCLFRTGRRNIHQYRSKVNIENRDKEIEIRIVLICFNLNCKKLSTTRMLTKQNRGENVRTKVKKISVLF